MLGRAWRWLSRADRTVGAVAPTDERTGTAQPFAHALDDELIRKARQSVGAGDVQLALNILLGNVTKGGHSQERIAAANTTLADLLQECGNFKEARLAIDRALSIIPDEPQLNYRAGVHALEAGEPELALDFFRLSRHYDPSYFPAYAGEAKALGKLGRRDDQRIALKVYLDRYPTHGAAFYELALWNYEQGLFEDAISHLESVRQDDPVFPESCNLSGLILGRDLGRPREAIRQFELALANRPGWTIALSNMGWMLSEAGDFRGATGMIDDVLNVLPNDAEVRLIRAYMNLKHGNFGEGWRDYSARHSSHLAVKRPYRFPAWNGVPGIQSSILVYAEQGLGDHMMFASCVSELSEIFESVHLECHPKLVSLFERSFPDVHIVPNVPLGEEPIWLNQAGKIDCQTAMGDLPGFFRDNWRSFPAHTGYLRADPARVSYWRSRLDQLGEGLKIGVSWRGGVQSTRQRLRSIPLSMFGPLSKKCASLVSLQYGDVASDIEHARSMGVEVVHWDDALSDYDETAALVCALDLTVSVCTAVIHLCGALGRPALVLVPKVAEWRYLHSGEKMPWYPSVTLIRQEVTGEWQRVIEEAVLRLRQVLDGY